MTSSTASPLEIQSALRHSFRLPSAGRPAGHSHVGRSPRVIRFGDEVDDSDLEMTEPEYETDVDDGRTDKKDVKKEQVWVREMLQELVSPHLLSLPSSSPSRLFARPPRDKPVADRPRPSSPL